METNLVKKIVDNQIMNPRFGHTITLVSKAKDKAKAVLFGGNLTKSLFLFLLNHKQELQVQEAISLSIQTPICTILTLKNG